MRPATLSAVAALTCRGLRFEAESKTMLRHPRTQRLKLATICGRNATVAEAASMSVGKARRGPALLRCDLAPLILLRPRSPAIGRTRSALYQHIAHIWSKLCNLRNNNTARFDDLRRCLFEAKQHMAQIGSHSLDVAKHRPNLDESWSSPNGAKIGSKSAESARSWPNLKSGQHLANIGQPLAASSRLRLNSGRFGRMRAKSIGRICRAHGQTLVDSARFKATSPARWPQHQKQSQISAQAA